MTMAIDWTMAVDWSKQDRQIERCKPSMITAMQTMRVV